MSIPVNFSIFITNPYTFTGAQFNATVIVNGTSYTVPVTPGANLNTASFILNLNPGTYNISVSFSTLGTIQGSSSSPVAGQLNISSLAKQLELISSIIQQHDALLLLRYHLL